jgi:hypothetical protein
VSRLEPHGRVATAPSHGGAHSSAGRGVGVADGVHHHAVYVVSAGSRTLTAVGRVSHCQATIIFGAAVYEGGRMAQVTSDRMTTGTELYKAGVVDKLLMSGDHGQVRYDEVTPMRERVLQAGVPAQDVFTDRVGFCTYHTIARRARARSGERSAGDATLPPAEGVASGAGVRPDRGGHCGRWEAVSKPGPNEGSGVGHEDEGFREGRLSAGPEVPGFDTRTHGAT